MEFLLLLSGPALLVWGIVAVFRGSIFLSVAGFLVSTACLPAEFLSVDAVGLTWTFDRLWLVVILAQLAVRWHRGEQRLVRLDAPDLALGLFAIWLVARTLAGPLGQVVPGQPGTVMHLVNGYLIPFGLYAALRTSPPNAQSLKPALWIMAFMGIYLAVTAVLEAGKMWGLVYPRFISDPALGIHFGRARGPMLQSVRLGVCLLACWVPLVVYTVWLKPHSRFCWAAALASWPLMWGAVFVTYTRSVWMGLGFAILVLVVFCLQGLSRRLVLFGMLAGCLAVGVVKGPDLVAFKREYSAAETRESTYMRAAFAYVSVEMFKDRPITGFGFNQFQVHNRTYLSDRSTNIRLESIRGYVHHNSYLSLLVDLGMIGLGLYTFVGLAFASQAWTLWQARSAPQWARGLALLAFAAGGVHLIQMAFHEVSFSTIENGFLYGILGLVSAAKLHYCDRPAARSADFSEGSPTGISDGRGEKDKRG